jgi:hypothetical protein
LLFSRIKGKKITRLFFKVAEIAYSHSFAAIHNTDFSVLMYQRFINYIKPQALKTSD